jgi:hypothetical protein
MITNRMSFPVRGEVAGADFDGDDTVIHITVPSDTRVGKERVVVYQDLDGDEVERVAHLLHDFIERRNDENYEPDPEDWMALTIESEREEFRELARQVIGEVSAS